MPVIHGPLSFLPLVGVVNVFDVHPRVLLEVSNCKFMELLGEQLVVTVARVDGALIKLPFGCVSYHKIFNYFLTIPRVV